MTSFQKDLEPNWGKFVEMQLRQSLKNYFGHFRGKNFELLHACFENVLKILETITLTSIWDKLRKCLSITPRQYFWIAAMSCFGNILEEIRSKIGQVDPKDNFERSYKKIRAKIMNCFWERFWEGPTNFPGQKGWYVAEKCREGIGLFLKQKNVNWSQDDFL